MDTLPVASSDLHEGPAVMITLPWLKHTNPVTATCVNMLRGPGTPVVLNFGDALVAHSRNRLADAFLKSRCEWQLTVDDDMAVPFGNGEWFHRITGLRTPEGVDEDVNAIDRLMSHGKTLVGGLYFGRNPHGKPIFADERASPGAAALLARAGKAELRPARWVGTGCLLIHRSVYEDIEREFPALARKSDGTGGQWFSSSEHDLVTEVDALLKEADALPPDRALNPEWILTALRDAREASKARSKLGTGEDVQFCLRAAQAGHAPYVDLGLLCGHLGQAVYGPHNTDG